MSIMVHLEMETNYVTTFPIRPNWNGLFEVKFIANDNVGYSSDQLLKYMLIL